MSYLYLFIAEIAYKVHTGVSKDFETFVFFSSDIYLLDGAAT